VNDDEPSPEVPYTITLTWAVGDALVVTYPDLNHWEARAALEEAVEIVRAEEQADNQREEN
jgi:hypothetical protein